ncbi:uncharacterized protein [Miscanthus floridulus]|uniref:uncharacterized protein n=1 Tax=Miscanthus floridulus TaxID=154761 RepID=UPI0034580F8F
MSGLAFLGGGGEADAPKAWALGKRADSPVGSIAEVEQAMAGAMQLPLRKRQAEVPTLAPRKVLKVSTSSTTQWVVEAQATIQRGVALARANPKEPVAHGEATKAAMEQAEEEEPTPREAEAHESDGAKVPLVAEATKGAAEAPLTSEAEATEAEVPRTTEAEVAEAGAPRTTEVGVAEAGVSVAKPVAKEAEMEVGQASILPLVQGPPPSQESAREVEVHSISSDDTS